MWCITLIDLRVLKNTCIPGIKPYANINREKNLKLNTHWFGGGLVAKSCLTLVTPYEDSLKLAKKKEKLLLETNINCENGKYITFLV